MHELARLAHRVRSLFGRGRVTLVDDSGPVQILQADMGPIGPDGSSLSIVDGIPRLAQFGFASNPPAQSDIAVLNLGGDRGNNVAIATNHQTYRLRNLGSGQVALYDQWGNTVVLSQSGMTLTHATQITLAAPTILLDSANVQLGASGGHAVARVGDPVSSGGTISAGSGHVTSD